MSPVRKTNHHFKSFRKFFFISIREMDETLVFSCPNCGAYLSIKKRNVDSNKVYRHGTQYSQYHYHYIFSLPQNGTCEPVDSESVGCGCSFKLKRKDNSIETECLS